MKRFKGASLIEVLIVMVVLSLLIITAIWAWRTQVWKGFDARRKSDLHRIRTAIEEYEKDHDCYPERDLLYCDDSHPAHDGTGLRPYLDKIPCDPRTKTDYAYEIPEEVCPAWFRLYTVLENTADINLQAGIGTGGSFNYYVSSPNAPRPDVSPSEFYGCKAGVCVPIGWDVQRPGPECDPNFLSPTCYSQCMNPQTGAPLNECQNWQ